MTDELSAIKEYGVVEKNPAGRLVVRQWIPNPYYGK